MQVHRLNLSLTRTAGLISVLVVFLAGGAVSVVAASQPGPLAEATQTPTDTTITAKVKADLLKSSLLTGLQVKVSTEEGVVQLAGYVDKAEQVTQAYDIASRVSGVKRVQNDLRIK